MSFYRATMRAGGPILFAVSLIVFTVTFAAQFKLGEQMTYQAFPSQEGEGGLRLTFFFTALATALSNAAYLFFGACIIDRVDRFMTLKGTAE